MCMDNEENNPVNIVVSAIKDAAFDSAPSDSDSPRDAWWLRWLKFLSVIIAPAVIIGVGFVVEDYIEQYRADSSISSYVAQSNVENDTVESMKFRFWLGAGIGGCLGMIYCVKCIIRKSDP